MSQPVYRGTQFGTDGKCISHVNHMISHDVIASEIDEMVFLLSDSPVSY